MGNAFCYCCSQCQGQNQIPENFMPDDFLKLQSMDDLKVLIDYIGEVLREKEKAKAERKKTTEPSTSTAQAKQEETTKPSSSVDSLIKSGRELTEKFSTGLNRHLRKKRLLCALDSRAAKVLAEVLKEAKSVPYAGMAFSIIAHLLERAELVKSNQDKCFRLLRNMFVLAKHMKDLDIHLDRTKLDDILRFIVKATVICATQMEPKLTNWFCRFICASLDYGDLQDLESQLQERHEDLQFGAIIEILNRIPKVPGPSQGLYPDYAVGIQEAENEVIKLLDLTDSNVRVVVIYGVGGIGKTTLASAVFSHLDLKDHIHCRVEIDQDSKSTDLKEKQEKILRNLFNENVILDDCTQGKEKLCEAFGKASKPVFLFIDNALKHSDLEKLLPMERFSLPKRSRILLTTRNLNEVRISSIQPFSYKLNALSTAEAKRLLCKHALGNADGSFYPAVDMDGLLQICEGIPLLLKLIGNRIRTKIQGDHHHTEIQSADENQVSVVCTKILEHYKTWKESGLEGEESKCMVDFVHGQLKETSKEAFLDIVFFFRGWERSKVAYIVGDIDLVELEGAALVSTSEEREWWESGEVEVKVHDIVRERGKRLSKGNRITDWDSWEDARKDEQKLRETKGIWLPGYDINLEAEHVALMSRSLRVLSLGKHPRLHGRCERTFKELRFLDISYEDLLTIQKSKLTKLKFLVVHLVEEQRDSQAQFTINLSQSLLCLEVHEYESSMLERFAESCGNLSSLRRLNMENCCIMESFPESFGNLSSLEKLDMCGCDRLQRLADSFGNLSSLKELRMAHCHNLRRLPESFGNLSSLEKLDISKCTGLKRLPESFGNLSSLKELDMFRCFKLEILPESFGNLSSLEKLDMSDCSELQRLPEIFGNLSSLKELDMRCCSMLETLPERFGNLSSLQELDMRGCRMLETLPDSFGNLSSLQKLNMSECVKLQRLPEIFGNLTSLQKLDMQDCSMLETLPESFGNLSSLNELDMHRCVKLQRLPERFGNLSSLQKLNMWECSMLETLPDSFGNLSSLKELDMCLCSELQRLPERFGNLSSLQELDMGALHMLETLPDSFGNLSSLRKFCMSACWKLQRLPERFGNLSSLQELDMGACSMLETLPDSFGNLSSLKELEMGCCDMLQRLPERFGNLSSLQKLNMEPCVKLQRLPERFGNLSSLQELHMRGCSMLETLPDSFGNLSSLQKLDMQDCSMLETLPDSFGNLSSLQKLNMSECVKLQRLLERFGNLSSLQELHMRGCSMLETLPDSFGNLSSLQKLVMSECVKLQRLPEIFGNLSFLQKLDMRGCSMLERLPESFGNLSSLQEVDISFCSSMERLPQSFHQLSRLQTLGMDNCEMICSLSDNFGGLKSLKLLSICNCKLNSLPEDIVSLPSLVAVKAYGCTQLEAKAMDSLVEIKSLIFLEMGESPMLIKRWKELIEQHRPLIGAALRFEDDKYPYEEIMSTMFFNGGSRFLHVDGDGELREVALCSSLDVEVEVGLLLTAACSLSEEQKHEIMEVASMEVQIIYVDVNVEGEEEAERKERIRKMLLQLPEGSRAWTTPFHKSSLLFAYSLWHFSGSVDVGGWYDGETCIVGRRFSRGVSVAGRETCIVRTRVVVDEEGRRELSLPSQMIYRADDCESRRVDFPTLFNSLQEACIYMAYRQSRSERF